MSWTRISDQVKVGNFWVVKCRCDCGIVGNVRVTVGTNSLRSNECHRCALVRRNEKPWPERFWMNVDKDGPIPEHKPELGKCWVWTAGKRLGYGRLCIDNRMQVATHVIWELVYGPLPVLPNADWRGTCICHHCDNRACVNPKHLFLGTHLENIADRDLKKRAARGENSGPRKHPECFPRGEQKKNAKLTESMVRDILELWATGEISQREIARKFKINSSSVCRIVNGEDWKHVRR